MTFRNKFLLVLGFAVMAVLWWRLPSGGEMASSTLKDANDTKRRSPRELAPGIVDDGDGPTPPGPSEGQAPQNRAVAGGALSETQPEAISSDEDWADTPDLGGSVTFVTMVHPTLAMCGISFSDFLMICNDTPPCFMAGRADGENWIAKLEACPSWAASFGEAKPATEERVISCGDGMSEVISLIWVADREHEAKDGPNTSPMKRDVDRAWAAVSEELKGKPCGWSPSVAR